MHQSNCLFISWYQQPFIYQSVGWLQLELKYLRFIIMQHTFPIFCTCIYATTWVWATEMWSLRVCASERCLEQRLHHYCELFMNTKPFQRMCVHFNVKNMSRLIVYTHVSASSHIHSSTLYVNMYVGHITELLMVLPSESQLESVPLSCRWLPEWFLVDWTSINTI